VLSSADVHAQWPDADRFVDTASYGLPPTAAWDELQAALSSWRRGGSSWEPWAETVERSRQCLARLLGVQADAVAAGASVSELVGLLAAAVPDGSRVLTAERDFTSLVFPWAVHAGRGVEVSAVPLEALASSIDASTTVVAVSAVQSATGETADIEGLLAAAAEHDVLTVLDVTQSLGWLPCRAERFDAVVGAAYKWLMAPRGVAYMYVDEERWPGLRPLHAGWFAGREPFDTYYGLPLRLSESARRLDTSPAWFCWVGAAPALELLERAEIGAVYDHNTELANRLRAGLGMAPSDTAIVAVGAALPEGGPKLRASSRNGRTRFSFHLYNTERDVDAILSALDGDGRCD
jgi:selenocysteine lyase/cysteine desulfurase